MILLVINSSELVVSNGLSFIELVTSIIRKFKSNEEQSTEIFEAVIQPVLVKFNFQDNIKELLKNKIA